MILDRLLEKKDLQIYIDNRIECLIDEIFVKMNNAPEHKRNDIRIRLKGRIAELRYQKKHIHDMKAQAKRYWLIQRRRQ